MVRREAGLTRPRPSHFRRGSQVVRQRSAKPLFAGSIPARASNKTRHISSLCPASARTTFTNGFGSGWTLLTAAPERQHHPSQLAFDFAFPRNDPRHPPGEGLFADRRVPVLVGGARKRP